MTLSYYRNIIEICLVQICDISNSTLCILSVQLPVATMTDLLGRVPLFPCFLDGNSTSTIPYKYAGRQKQAFEFGCADGQGPSSRRGSHVYEINDWLWNFGRPQSRVGGLSVAKTERIRRKSRSETVRRDIQACLGDQECP